MEWEHRDACGTGEQIRRPLPPTWVTLHLRGETVMTGASGSLVQHGTDRTRSPERLSCFTSVASR